MGCGISARMPYKVDDAGKTGHSNVELEPKLLCQTDSFGLSVKRSPRTSAAAEGAIAAKAARSSIVSAFPMYVMHMRDFLSLQLLRPHDELVVDGLVKSLDQIDIGAKINFISHQWVGWKDVDPQGAHLHTMQAVFQKAAHGESIFKSEDDWQSYAAGFSKTNAAFVKTSSGGARDDSGATIPEAFAQNMHNSWVWMDFISIPQLNCKYSYLKDPAEKQMLAIRSIPFYVTRADNFWVCAPSETKHVDGDYYCDYASWASRGWCRLEETCLAISKQGNGRPLLCCQPLGQPPRVQVMDSMDRLTVHTQRHTAVLTGDFTCCRLNHTITLPDGTQESVACDKDALRDVLNDLYERQISVLRSSFQNDPAHSGDFWECFFASMRSGDRSFFKFILLRMQRLALLAEQVEEPDLVEQGWCKPAHLLGIADLELYCESWGVTYPQKHMIGLAAHEGNLPMMQFIVKQGDDSDFTFINPIGLTALIDASRLGAKSVVQYILEQESVDAAYINHCSPSSGVNALCDTSMRGHPDVIKLLLAHHADINIRRKDGKNALHCAAEQGYADCVRVLLGANADPHVQDNDGHTPIQLLETWHTEARAVFTERADLE